MGKHLLLIGKKTKELEDITRLLSSTGYDHQVIENIDQIEETLTRICSYCIIFDLDSIDIDNRTIRKLTVEHPSIYFLCMSKDRFHPELKDAICYHIYACLTKPLDNDELLYWLRCIDNEQDFGPSANNEES
jgi:DNA-binding NtrC family response regulator